MRDWRRSARRGNRNSQENEENNAWDGSGFAGLFVGDSRARIAFRLLTGAMAGQYPQRTELEL